MIVVDTSVWIAVRRKPAGDYAETLRALLDADEVALALPVRIELLSGTAKQDRRAFRRALSALPIVMPTEKTWRLLESWVAPATDAGQRFGITDLLIAALAHDLGALVWSLDRDVAAMAKLGFVQVYR